MQNSNQDNLRDKLLGSLNTTLVKDGWIAQECEVCKCLFYGTKKYKICASEKCGEPEISFDGKPNHFTSLEELKKRIELFFNKSGYSIEKPPHMLHSKNKSLNVKNLEDSLFTMAGVQLLDDFLFFCSSDFKYQKSSSSAFSKFLFNFSKVLSRNSLYSAPIAPILSNM